MVPEEHQTLDWQTTRREEARTNQTRRGPEKVISDKQAQRIENNLLVLLQVNCRSILTKSPSFFNLTYTFLMLVRSNGLERKVAMPKNLGAITQLSGEAGIFTVL
jgi:hypothetical protein